MRTSGRQVTTQPGAIKGSRSSVIFAVANNCPSLYPSASTWSLFFWPPPADFDVCSLGPLQPKEAVKGPLLLVFTLYLEMAHFSGVMLT